MGYLLLAMAVNFLSPSEIKSLLSGEIKIPQWIPPIIQGDKFFIIFGDAGVSIECSTTGSTVSSAISLVVPSDSTWSVGTKTAPLLFLDSTAPSVPFPILPSLESTAPVDSFILSEVVFAFWSCAASARGLAARSFSQRSSPGPFRLRRGCWFFGNHDQTQLPIK